MNDLLKAFLSAVALLAIVVAALPWGARVFEWGIGYYGHYFCWVMGGHVSQYGLCMVP